LTAPDEIRSGLELAMLPLVREQRVDLAAVERNQHLAEARITSDDLERPAFVRFQHTRRDRVLERALSAPTTIGLRARLRSATEVDAGAPVNP